MRVRLPVLDAERKMMSELGKKSAAARRLRLMAQETREVGKEPEGKADKP